MLRAGLANAQSVLLTAGGYGGMTASRPKGQAACYTKIPAGPLKTPLISQWPEGMSEHGLFSHEGGEAFDQWAQPCFRHVRDQFVEHASLAVSASVLVARHHACFIGLSCTQTTAPTR